MFGKEDEHKGEKRYLTLKNKRDHKISFGIVDGEHCYLNGKGDEGSTREFPWHPYIQHYIDGAMVEIVSERWAKIEPKEKTEPLPANRLRPSRH